MIPPEKQVTSFVISKRLKELGVKQDSLFAWYQYSGSVYCEYREHQASCDAQSTYQDGYAKLPVEICATFTVAELGEILPIIIKPKEEVKEYYLYSTKRGGSYEVLYAYEYPGHHKGQGGLLCWRSESDIIEANARAKMLIYLIENKLMGANE